MTEGRTLACSFWNLLLFVTGLAVGLLEFSNPRRLPADLKPSQPSIALLFTTFPKTSETFLQRDVAALKARGLNIRLYSLWGGGGEFQGLPVHAFNLWRLVPLFLFIIPWNCV